MEYNLYKQVIKYTYIQSYITIYFVHPISYILNNNGERLHSDELLAKTEGK